MGISAWLGSTNPLSDYRSDVDRAYDTARRINESPTTITIIRNGAAQSAQVVRLEPSGGASEQQGSTMTASRAGVVVLGYKSHPTITDTDIQRGDRFLADGQMYDVTQVLPDTPDCVIAIAEARE